MTHIETLQAVSQAIASQVEHKIAARRIAGADPIVSTHPLPWVLCRIHRGVHAERVTCTNVRRNF